MEKNNYISVLVVAIVAIVGIIVIFSNNSNKVAYVDSGDAIVSDNLGGQAYGASKEVLCGKYNIFDEKLMVSRLESCVYTGNCKTHQTPEEMANFKAYNNCLRANGEKPVQQIIFDKIGDDDYHPIITAINITKLTITGNVKGEFSVTAWF